MPAPTVPPPPPEPLRFTLAVRPETPHARWRATLVAREGGTAAEFDSPLELARHIAALSLAERHGGLR